MIQQYENLETPFYYEYADGWAALLQNISTYILILALIIGFFVSGIFSDEFQTKAASIFFSTKSGRNKGTLAKIGADGANCPVQLDLWRSVYNITFLQAYFLL